MFIRNEERIENMEYDAQQKTRFVAWYTDIYSQNAYYRQNSTLVYNLGMLLIRFPVLSDDLKKLGLENERLPRQSSKTRTEFEFRYQFNRSRIPRELTDENVYRLFASFLEQDQSK
jgi:hypothetical protein